jgi:hypothetical protein
MFWFPARRQGCSASATRCFNGVERCCVGPCETAWVSLPCLSFAAVGIARAYYMNLPRGVTTYVKIDDGVSPASYVRI